MSSIAAGPFRLALQATEEYMQVANLKVVKPDLTGIERLVSDYLADCRARGLSPRTVKGSYGYPLHHVFLPWCAENQITEPAQVTRPLLNRLNSQLLDQGGARGELSRHSVHAYLRAVNHFLGWAQQQDLVDARAKAQLPKLPRRVLDTLSRKEIGAIEDAARTERDKLIVRILANTGIRVGELVALRVGDVIERNRQRVLKVHGKGSIERFVPLAPPELYRRLERFARSGRPKRADSDRLFLGARRSYKTGNYEPITESGVQQLIRALAEEAGVHKEGGVYPHLFRHSYATEMLRRGMNPIQLKDILGHSSLEMISRVYSHLTSQDAYEAALTFLAKDREEE